MNKLTLDQKQEKLEKIAGYSIQVLTMASNAELTDLCRGLVSNHSKMSKADKVAALHDVTIAIRERAEKILETQVLKESLEIDEKLLEAIEASKIVVENNRTLQPLTESANPDNATNLGIALYAQIKSIVTELCLVDRFYKYESYISNLALETIVNESATKSLSTLSSRRTDYIKAIKASLNCDNDVKFVEELALAVDFFESRIQKALSKTVSATNSKYAEKVKASNLSRTEIVASDILKGAITVLSNPTEYKWTETVRALGLVTGRRPSEIVCSARMLKVSEHWMSFQGQAKRRGSFDPSYQYPIPVLCKPELIENGFEYLKEADRRFTYDSSTSETHTKSLQVAGDKVSKELSRAVVDDLTMKDLRAIYENLTYEIFSRLESTKEYIPGINEPTDTAWAAYVLGHYGSDQTTAHSYTRFYIPAIELDAARSILGIA